MKIKYFEELKSKLIYVFRISDEAHRDCLKIGEATIDVDPDEVDITTIPPNSKVLNQAARNRIDQYTTTAGIAYELLYTETASYRRGSRTIGFNDKDVHEVLKRSGIQRKEFKHINKGGKEWFITDLETAKLAIAAVKQGHESLTPGEKNMHRSPIEFRPEQAEAIDKTVKLYKKAAGKTRSMLWNAKMRFGKTLSALQVIKTMKFERTLILTHRPVVDKGWYDDFDKIFYDSPQYAYGSKNIGSTFDNLEHRHQTEGLHYVYFASIQDLRGSETVGGKFDKNDSLFATPWELIIIDEAHEGTQTELGQAVISELTKKSTKILQLTGTAFNLMDDIVEEEMFTWDYTMEQRAKQEWDKNHFGDPNPYACLPRMNIYTYDLGRLMHDFVDEDIAFNFREFFRTTDSGSFLHHAEVRRFLDLLTKEDPESMYPFANAHYRSIFRHTLWMLPGVKAAKALSAMLKEHPVFGKFSIVNVAGDGDEEEDRDEALKKVNKAIDEATFGTITLSCGRLTTGVSVPQWMGVLMLAGSFNTAASSYMQTIFRVQTPYSANGLVKEDCYVFDFAPDRTLQVLATVPRVSGKAGKTTESQRQALGDFLNFCPVIGLEGSVMKPYDVNKMMEQLKKAYVERVVRNGFEDGYLYTDELLKLDEVAVKDFDNLKGIIGQTKAIGSAGSIDVNAQGLTGEEYEEKEKLEKKKKKDLTEAEKQRLEELKKKKKVQQDAISILRGISIRMPLLIYGAEIDNEEQQLTIHNFTSLIDPQSWEEFMPRGVTKQIFNKFKRYYDPDIFAAAGKRIRAMARAADRLTIEERVERITAIFATFRNPDKETVLTPWRVVNMHLSDTLGGYTFFNDDFSETVTTPRYVYQAEVTDQVFAPSSHLLEINSKSGLYPLYLAYNLYRRVCHHTSLAPKTLEEHLAIWDKVVRENIFVVCKTPMAKAITKRTLMGFRNGKVNMWAPDDLINKIKNQPELFVKKVHDLVGKDVKINAIVGNPPYQEEGENTRKTPIYHLFYDIAFQLTDKVTLITPARYLFHAGQTPKEWMDRILSNPHFKVVRFYQKSSAIFDNVDIKGGVAIGYYDAHSDFGPIGFFSEYEELKTIVNKVLRHVSIKNGGFARIVSSQGIYRFSELALSEHPHILQVQGKGTGTKIVSNTVEKLSDIFYEDKPEDAFDYIQVFSRINNQREYRWIRRDYIQSVESLDCWKVFVPEANGTGAIGEVLSTPVIGTPAIGHTDTFLTVGNFASLEEATACLKYVKTKFARCLLGTLKATQHNPSVTWANVPLQDFTSTSDIDWSQSVADIDRQLYAKYGLTEDEVAFIESMIKPM